MAVQQRGPYVGEGVDGCHRSAQIDREEAETLDVLDVRRDELYASVETWERQAEQLEQVEPGKRPRRPESERRSAEPASRRRSLAGCSAPHGTRRHPARHARRRRVAAAAGRPRGVQLLSARARGSWASMLTQHTSRQVPIPDAAVETFVKPS